jgi:hypothetical protein
MERCDSTTSSGAATTNTIALAAFSLSIAVTYVGLGFFAVAFLAASLIRLYLTVAAGLPSLLISGAVFLSLGIGFIYVMWALRKRFNWARLACAAFWLLCLIWSALAIVRNGWDPEALSVPSGPLRYSNADQVLGARLAAFMIPYSTAVLESTAIYGLLRKASFVRQFKRSGET